jgi:hypothetical protein
MCFMTQTQALFHSTLFYYVTLYKRVGECNKTLKSRQAKQSYHCNCVIVVLLELKMEMYLRSCCFPTIVLDFDDEIRG